MYFNCITICTIWTYLCNKLILSQMCEGKRICIQLSVRITIYKINFNKCS